MLYIFNQSAYKHLFIENFMNNQTSLELDLKTQDFISRAESLLKKIGAAGNQAAAKNQKKFKDTIMDIWKQKKPRKQSQEISMAQLLQQIEMMSREVEQQRNLTKSMHEEIKERASVFQKQNKKMIDNLKAERVQTENRLNMYLENEVRNLKTKTSISKQKNSQINQWKDEVSNIRKQMKLFFEKAEIQENEMNKRISCFIEECYQMLGQIEDDDLSGEALEHMRLIQSEICKKIKNLALQRLTMEESVLNLFETIISHSR